ncbi:MAG: 8-amino-7-oxononanoate synthase [Flavobacteriaceae bacterium]|jgi:8-amino-7-oxononanoate synthase
MLPNKLQRRIDNRIANNASRSLKGYSNLIDFSSNDYLGFSTSEDIFNNASQLLKDKNHQMNGATGSRLLSGNYNLYQEAEKTIAEIHKVESALIFNSGYDANIGFFSAVPQRGDFIFYDESIHASIRDGISMSNAKSYKFKHNDLQGLKELVSKIRSNSRSIEKDSNEIYIATESVFSMDGDSPDLSGFANFCTKIGAHFIVDEAHAIGVFGLGLVQQLSLENKVFARLVTFGKGLGCHGAAFLGDQDLKDYLVNFARSFIYTTALPPHSVATIISVYEQLNSSNNDNELQKNIKLFKRVIKNKEIDAYFVTSHSAIQSCVLSSNEKVKNISLKLKEQGFDVKPILSPTVKLGQERLRFCLHSYNTEKEILSLINLLSTFLK